MKKVEGEGDGREERVIIQYTHLDVKLNGHIVVPVDDGSEQIHLISLTNTLPVVAAAATPMDATGAENTGTEAETSAVEHVLSPNGNGGGSVPVVEEKQQQ